MHKKLRRKVVYVLAGFFLLNSLLPGFGTELQKLPSLVNHYQHHLEDHEAVGFLDFLALHYDSESEHSKSESHEDLPLFQGVSAAFHAITQELFVFKSNTLFAFGSNYQSLEENHYAYTPVGSLFQPPKQG